MTKKESFLEKRSKALTQVKKSLESLKGQGAKANQLNPDILKGIIDDVLSEIDKIEKYVESKIEDSKYNKYVSKFEEV